MANEDAAYTDWIRRQPCDKCGRHPTEKRPTTPHHAGRKGMSQRVHDRRTIPLCHQCHMDLHALSGWAKGMVKVERKMWEADRVSFYQRLYGQAF